MVKVFDRWYDAPGWRILLAFLLTLVLNITPAPHRFNQALSLAQRASAQGSFSDAVGYLSQAAEVAPWRGDLWEKAAHCALLSGDIQNALSFLEKSRTGGFYPRRGLSPQGWLELGEAYLRAGDYGAAQKAWKEASAFPEVAAHALLRRAQLSLALGDFLSAKADAQAALQLQPKEAQVHYLLGLLLAPEDPEAALYHLDQAAILDVALAEQARAMSSKIFASRSIEAPGYILVEVGRVLASFEEWELAMQAFYRGTQMQPDYAEAWAFLGEAMQHIQPPEGAAELPTAYEALQTALQLNPKSVSAWTFLSLYWSRHNAYSKAVEALQSAIGLEENNPWLYVELGNLRAAYGELNLAYAAFRRAVSLSESDAAIWKYLVEFSLNYDYLIPEVALPGARHALTLRPHDPLYLDLLAQVFIKLEDFSSAYYFLMEALRLDEDLAEAHLHLAMVYLARGENRRAYQELMQVIALDEGGESGQHAARLLSTYFP